MKRIKIGPQVFTVKVVNNLQGPDGADLDGHIRYAKSLILLDADQDDFMKLQTLWHEILHGICTQAGIRDESEQIVDALSWGIISVLKSNPVLREAKWS